MKDSLEDSDVSATIRAFESALLSMDRLRAQQLILEAPWPTPPMEKVEQLIMPALEEIGRQWDEGQLALSQIYMSGRICEELVELLLPPAQITRNNQPITAIATLEDHHLLGKRMVYAAMRASGFELHDFGRMDAMTLAQTCVDKGIKVLLISALMLPSALAVATLRQELDRLNYQVYIIVGGAPFRIDKNLWKQVGADATGRNAADAVKLVQAQRGIL